VVPIDRYFFRDLRMDLLLSFYATPIKKYIKNDSAVVNTKKWAFSRDMGSRCKFVVAGGLFNKLFSLALVAKICRILD
jgi:hypothetical protein